MGELWGSLWKRCSGQGILVGLKSVRREMLGKVIRKIIRKVRINIKIRNSINYSSIKTVEILSMFYYFWEMKNTKVF